MKKSKLLKTLGFSSLALLVALTGGLVFTPLNNTSAEEIVTITGLITPKIDDPIIYKTENGLDIKWGNALPSSYNNSFGSGVLKGFPYFTTSKSGTTYTWIIIGANEDVKSLFYDFTANLYSKWKTNFNTVSGTFANYYFSNNDSSSPCGALIENTISSKTFIVEKVVNSLVKNSTEVPSGCALVLLNESINPGTGYINFQYIHTYDECFNGKDNLLRNLHIGYYDNDTFGFGTMLNQIQPTTVHQTNQVWTNNQWYKGITNSTTLHFFPMATGSYSNENFVLSNYLTLEQRKNSPYYTAGRSTLQLSSGHHYTAWWSPDGTVRTTTTQVHDVQPNGDENRRVRPACVIKIT